MEEINPNQLLKIAIAFLGIVCIIHLLLGKKYIKDDKPVIEKHEEHFSVDENGELIEPKYFKRFS